LRLDDFIIYLDENLHRCQPIIDALADCQISCRRHEAEGFAPGEDDDVWLKYVSERGWIVLTKDKKNRYNDLERSAVRRFKTREFYFGGGSLNKFDMADALRLALPEMRRIIRRYISPVIGSITRSGSITVVFDEEGSTHERRQIARALKNSHEL
jgi:hypothetical protein